MSREAKEQEIARIFKGFTRTADATIFAHALSTYGGTGSLAKQVTELGSDDFEMFYGDVMDNWGGSAQKGESNG